MTLYSFSRWSKASSAAIAGAKTEVVLCRPGFSLEGMGRESRYSKNSVSLSRVSLLRAFACSKMSACVGSGGGVGNLKLCVLEYSWRLCFLVGVSIPLDGVSGDLLLFILCGSMLIHCN